jgi:hypothetical protein
MELRVTSMAATIFLDPPNHGSATPAATSTWQAAEWERKAAKNKGPSKIIRGDNSGMVIGRAECSGAKGS